jgi:DNA-binding transcriptional ArsR family regulator
MTPQSDNLDRMFHALADPHRRNMVDRLSRGPASVKELAQPGNLPLPSALKHLGVLEAGGIVLSEKVGRVRTFRMQPAALGTLEDWVAERKLNWNRTFDRLDQLMAEYPEEPGHD